MGYVQGYHFDKFYAISVHFLLYYRGFKICIASSRFVSLVSWAVPVPPRFCSGIPHHSAVQGIHNPFNDKHKGYGFVTFKEESSIEEAMQLSGREVCHRKIRVNHATFSLEKLPFRVRITRCLPSVRDIEACALAGDLDHPKAAALESKTLALDGSHRIGEFLPACIDRVR
eukprot:264696-Pyramimonas_sp.AAC.1